MLSRLCYITALVAVFAVRFASAQAAEQGRTVQQFLDSLHFQTGTVQMPKAHATLKLTSEFRYLDEDNAQRVLTELWGNPPDSDVLGMLVPTAASLGDTKNSWAVVITYSSDGYVSDEDATEVDYDQMLKEMQESTQEQNAERVKQGYRELELVGWAAKPYYDQATNKLYWAKELSAKGAREHSLNYDIRALGRGGYLSLNAVAGISQLPMVKTEMQKVLAMVEFDAGQRYADFNASTDKVAAYGIGALVAGAIATKAGLFAKLLVMLMAFKKIAIVGVIAIGAALRQWFGRNKSS